MDRFLLGLIIFGVIVVLALLNRSAAADTEVQASDLDRRSGDRRS